MFVYKHMYICKYLKAPCMLPVSCYASFFWHTSYFKNAKTSNCSPNATRSLLPLGCLSQTFLATFFSYD